jgi:hypothetical protein
LKRSIELMTVDFTNNLQIFGLVEGSSHRLPNRPQRVKEREAIQNFEARQIMEPCFHRSAK